MKFRNLALATAALSLAASPAIAEAAFERSVAPMEGESQIGGGNGEGDGSSIILAILAAAGIIAGVVVAAGGGDDAPNSP